MLFATKMGIIVVGATILVVGDDNDLVFDIFIISSTGIPLIIGWIGAWNRYKYKKRKEFKDYLEWHTKIQVWNFLFLNSKYEHFLDKLDSTYKEGPNSVYDAKIKRVQSYIDKIGEDYAKKYFPSGRYMKLQFYKDRLWDLE